MWKKQQRWVTGCNCGTSRSIYAKRWEDKIHFGHVLCFPGRRTHVNIFVTLTTNSDAAVTLMIWMDNLYLEAYQVQGSGRWFEFGRGPSHLIDGSTFLGFNSDYHSMELAGGVSLIHLKLGQLQLIEAVKLLANYDDRMDQAFRRDQRAAALITIIQMICESTRFIYISDYLAKNFSSSLPPPNRMLELEHGWSLLSLRVQQAYNMIPPHFDPPQKKELEIDSIDEALKVLGIMLFNECSSKEKKESKPFVVRGVLK